ncbi:choice-of-anchor M domain-containing protein [Promicromonospora sukumoe]|uniref:choice-of-anchor M domain-containing protein n=1 Tax=Promicromonospora sukumoe TaxID=88382 RepID=UPI0037C50C83
MTTRTARGRTAAWAAAALLTGLTAISAGPPAAAHVAAGAPAAGALAVDVDDPTLDQTVDTGEAVVREDTVVTDGHVDVGPRLLDGEWTMLARDDREVPSIWRAPEQTAFHLGDEAVLPAPDSPDFEFLGVEPGTPLHVVPQTQAPDVPWLGWNTQDPQVVDVLDQGATLRLDGVDGPGEIFVFLQEGVTGPPNVLWDSGEALPQDLWMETNTHVHANWVFTEPGTYLLDVTMLSDLTDGSAVEDASTLVFAVGADTDPDEALAATAETAADEPAAEPSATDGASETASAEAGTTPLPDAPAASGPSSAAGGTLLWWAFPAGLVLVLILVVRVVRSRRARAAADAGADDAGPDSDQDARATR